MTNYLILKTLEYEPYLDSLKWVFKYINDNKQDIEIKNIIDDSLRHTLDDLLNHNKKIISTASSDSISLQMKREYETTTMCHIWTNLVRHGKIFINGYKGILSTRWNNNEIKIICDKCTDLQNIFVVLNLQKALLEKYIK